MTIGQAATEIRKSAHASTEEFSATLYTILQSPDCFDLVFEYSTAVNVPIPEALKGDRTMFLSLTSGFGSMAMGVMIGKMIERANAQKEKV